MLQSINAPFFIFFTVFGSFISFTLCILASAVSLMIVIPFPITIFLILYWYLFHPFFSPFKIPFPFICITPSSLRIHVAFFPHFPFATVLAADVCIFVKQTILNRNRNTSNVFFIKSSFLDTKGIKLFYPLFYHYYFSTLDASISNRYCVLFPILLPVAGAITNLKLPL